MSSKNKLLILFDGSNNMVHSNVHISSMYVSEQTLEQKTIAAINIKQLKLLLRMRNIFRMLATTKFTIPLRCF